MFVMKQFLKKIKLTRIIISKNLRFPSFRTFGVFKNYNSCLNLIFILFYLIEKAHFSFTNLELIF